MSPLCILYLCICAVAALFYYQFASFQSSSSPASLFFLASVCPIIYLCMYFIKDFHGVVLVFVPISSSLSLSPLSSYQAIPSQLLTKKLLINHIWALISRRQKDHGQLWWEVRIRAATDGATIIALLINMLIEWFLKILHLVSILKKLSKFE